MKLTKIGDFLKRSKIPIDILDSQEYKRVTIRINHNGVSLRDTEIGKKIGTKKQFILKSGQFIVSKIDARYGAFGIAPEEVDNAIITGNFWAYEVDFSKLNIEWFNQFTNSRDFYDLCERASTGITHRKYLNESFFLNYEIMLPSVEEQLIQIDKIKLQKISFGDLTSELNYQLDLIKQLRQSFLQEAMQGKLFHAEFVEGNESGSQLLAKIKTEKAKLIKAKKLKAGLASSQSINLIDDYIIPNNWTWCKADEIFFITKLAGFEYSEHIKLSEHGEIPVVRAQNVRPLNIEKKNLLYIDRQISELLERCALTKKCLLVTFIGAGIGDVATFEENERWHLAPNVSKMEPFLGCEDFLSVKFINYFMMSDIGQKEIFKHVKATAQPSLSMGTIRDIDIPLPPFNEQEQIVAKLEQLMSFCDTLEQSIKESQKYNEKLLQQVLREVLQPREETKIIDLESRKIEQPLKTILAGHIINQCNTTDFGRVKFQKLLYLTEYYCKIDFDSNYVKKAAGPYDEDLIKKIEADFSRMRFFNVVQDKTDTKRVHYTALPAASQINSMFLENFNDESLQINSLLMKLRPLSWSECEVVATIYAVWNNRILKGEPCEDNFLYDDFMAWDAQKIKYKDSFYKKLFWMKEENIIPDGWGNFIDKPDRKMA